jgi:hypothetical protein
MGERSAPVLDRPTNEYLRRISAVLFRDALSIKEGKRETEPTYFLREFLQHKIPKLSPDQGSVCLNYDTMQAAIINNSFLLTEWVELV